MDFTGFNQDLLKIIYDFDNPRAFQLKLPPFSANLDYCGFITPTIEGPKSVADFLKGNNISVIPRKDTGAAEGFEILVNTGALKSSISSTTDPLTV